MTIPWQTQRPLVANIYQKLIIAWKLDDCAHRQVLGECSHLCGQTYSLASLVRTKQKMIYFKIKPPLFLLFLVGQKAQLGISKGIW